MNIEQIQKEIQDKCKKTVCKSAYTRQIREEKTYGRHAIERQSLIRSYQRSCREAYLEK